MENNELKKSIPEELNEEELSMLAGAVDNSVAIPSLPCSNPNILRCTECGKLKRIDLLFIYNEKRICNECR